MSRSLTLFISCLALAKSFRQEGTHSLKSETASSVVPSPISEALRLARQKAVKRSKEADEKKKAKEEADSVAAEAVNAAQAHLAEQREKEEAASEERKKNVQAGLEKEAAAKESTAKTDEWDAAVGIKSKLEYELSDATEKLIKRKAEVDEEIAKLMKEVGELQDAKTKLEAKVVVARASAEGLRLAAVASGDIHVDKLKDLEQSDKALKDAERDLEEQTQAAQETSAEADLAREAAASAKIELEKASLKAERRKATVNRLKELRTAVNTFYKNVDSLSEALETDSMDEDEKPYDRITQVDEVKPVLVSFNEVSLAYANLKQDDAEVFADIKESIPEIKRNAKEAIHTACDPLNELAQKRDELNQKCGSGMYRVLKLEMIPMPKAR